MIQATITSYAQRTDAVRLYYDLKESGRLSNQRGRIAEILIDGLPHHCGELSRVASQYNARIYELRRLGFTITSSREGDRTWFVMVH